MPIRKQRESLPKEGTILAKQYAGRTIEAIVVGIRPEIGRVIVEMDGIRYKSLSAAAKALTGTEVNGWKFWGLE